MRFKKNLKLIMIIEIFEVYFRKNFEIIKFGFFFNECYFF